MDSILLLGCVDEKLVTLLSRMGYRLVKETEELPLASLLSKEVIDLIVLDGRGNPEPVSICEFLRRGDLTRDIPIVYIIGQRTDAAEIRDLGLEKVECIPTPYTPGIVVSKVATQLRLRKMSGADDRTATLAEMNATLRDLNARFARELEEARAIQAALLPREMPSGDSFDVAAHYKPLEEVGGDWYFVKEESGGKISIFLADVTGHGLSAAFIGSMTKLALSAAGPCLPHEVLREMNRLMAPQIPQGRFVTAFAFLFDPKTGVLDFARAGSPPAIFFRAADSNASELKGEGFPLAFFEEAEYTHESIKLEPGDTVAIVTDGVTEAQNRAKKFFGSEGVISVLKGTKPEDSAQRVLDALLMNFEAFLAGRILKDDVTVVVLKRRVL